MPSRDTAASAATWPPLSRHEVAGELVRDAVERYGQLRAALTKWQFEGVAQLPDDDARRRASTEFFEWAKLLDQHLRYVESEVAAAGASAAAAASSEFAKAREHLRVILSFPPDRYYDEVKGWAREAQGCTRTLGDLDDVDHPDR